MADFRLQVQIINVVVDATSVYSIYMEYVTGILIQIAHEFIIAG